jgi:hypothetical protein
VTSRAAASSASTGAGAAMTKVHKARQAMIESFIVVETGLPENGDEDRGCRDERASYLSLPSGKS